MEFQPFPKIPRLNRECVITEKIDGMNAQVVIAPVEEIYGCVVLPLFPHLRVGDFWIGAGSRTRYISPENDNHGFAAWVWSRAEELVQLGPGRHFGEWWGGNIQRGYGIAEKRFSLFDTGRWVTSYRQCAPPYECAATRDPLLDGQQYAPECCDVVPVLYRGPFSTERVAAEIERLRTTGSVAAPGYMNPEGIVVFHGAANEMFNVTLEKDEQPKGGAA